MLDELDRIGYIKHDKSNPQGGGWNIQSSGNTDYIPPHPQVTLDQKEIEHRGDTYKTVN